MTNRPDKPTTRRKTNTRDVPPAGDDAAVRLITTKHRTYALPVDQAGIPVQDYFPAVEWSGPFASAKIYETTDGPVLALPEAAMSETPRPTSPQKKRRGPQQNLG
jgi:hypothetical protein